MLVAERQSQSTDFGQSEVDLQKKCVVWLYGTETTFLALDNKYRFYFSSFLVLVSLLFQFV